MSSARKIYEALGFQKYKEMTVPYGQETEVTIFWYRLEIGKEIDKEKLDK